MGSFLFVCVRCLGRSRLVSTEGRDVYVPPDFDNICDSCREVPEPKPVAALATQPQSAREVKARSG